jgi:thiosulfate/3-mercaptopyruvate sulfurtransferase
MTYPNSQFLLSAQDLQARLADEDLRLFDVTVFLRPQKKGMVVESGAKIYADGHIPGAAFIDQLTELSVTDAPFRFTLPPAEHLTSAFAAAGISAHHNVVFYSSDHLMWATRAWWLLRYCGHDQVAVLDGGLAAWQAAGFELEKSENCYAPDVLEIQARTKMFVDIQSMAAAGEQGTHFTINALPAEIHVGTIPMNAGRAGHIPGSCNLPCGTLLRQVGDVEPKVECFSRAAELEQTLQEANLLGAEPVITYCGGGIAATVDAFACMLMGKTEVAVYDGSMAEWASDPDRPMVTGS